MERYEGNIDKAEQVYRETIPIWQKLGHRAAVANQLECLAFIAIAHKQGERATKLLGAAEGLREKVNIPMSPPERVEYERQIIDLRSEIDEKTFTSMWAAGRAMSMDEAIAYALESTYD